MKQSWWLSQYRIACNSGDLSAIPESGIHHGEENGNPCQCSCLENSMDRGIWWATVHGITEESDRTEWPTLTFTSYTTMKQQRETWKWNNPRNAEKKRRDCWQPKTTKKVTEDGIWGPDRRRILSMEGRRDGDKDVCRCRQGSLGLSGKSGGVRQEGV